MKNILKNTRLYLKKIYKRFTSHNPNYRIFVVLVYTIWMLTLQPSGDFWSDVIGYFLIVIFLSSLTFFIVDKHFRKGMRSFINSGMSISNNTNAPTETSKFTQEDFFSIVKFIKDISTQFLQYLQAKIMNTLTRFPFFENYGLNTSSHYRYRHIRLLLDYLERKNHQININKVSLNEYFCILKLSSKTNLATEKFNINTKKMLKSYFKKDPDGLVIRQKRRTAELLIPMEYLID